MKSKVSVLFTLGEASRSRKWPDYLKHGFTSEDVSELVELVLNKDLHQAGGETPEVWIPLHAWRALGQIRSAEAVEPLLSMFDYLENDDWALEEMPLVMGMIGEPSLEALSNFLLDSAHGEYARAMAAHGIKEVVVHNPQTRDKAVKLLTDYLEQPDPINISLNAMVVNYLIDLKAKESIETIKSLYAKGLADLASAGDIEDVEMELGVRKSRSTPKPNYLADSLLSKMPKPVDDDIDELIEYYLEKYGSDDAVLNVSELDGFLASITCSPEMIKPSKWTHAMWGGSNQTPEWESIDEAQSFMSAVMPVYNDVVTHMRIGIYEPLYMEANMGGKVYPIVEDWCAGFMKGLELWPRLSPQNTEVLLAQTETIRFFAEEEDF